MKKITIILLLSMVTVVVPAQTFHSIIMVNKEESAVRKADRTAEFNNMSAFLAQIAKALGYRDHMLQYSGTTFKATIALQAIESLNIEENDIVVFYYSGHGANWDDDEWPHMAFLDRQYSESALYNKLKEKCNKAKMILCISACCNMDSEGNSREKRTYNSLDPEKVKKLFTDFEGHHAFKISSSIRGEYSLSATGYNGGPIFSISFREAIRKSMTGEVKTNMIYVLEETKRLTMWKAQNWFDKPYEQMPQFQMERW